MSQRVSKQTTCLRSSRVHDDKVSKYDGQNHPIGRAGRVPQHDEMVRECCTRYPGALSHRPLVVHGTWRRPLYMVAVVPCPFALGSPACSRPVTYLALMFHPTDNNNTPFEAGVTMGRSSGVVATSAAVVRRRQYVSVCWGHKRQPCSRKHTSCMASRCPRHCLFRSSAPKMRHVYLLHRPRTSLFFAVVHSPPISNA